MQESPALQKEQNSSAVSLGEPGAQSTLVISLSHNKLLSGYADLQYVRGRGRMNLAMAGDPQLITTRVPPACAGSGPDSKLLRPIPLPVTSHQVSCAAWYLFLDWTQQHVVKNVPHTKPEV